MFFETTLTDERINEMAATGAWDNRLLDEWLVAHVFEKGDQPFIHDRFGTMTWAEFGEEVTAVSRGLLEIGVRPGGVVMLQLPNWRQFAVAVCAIERIGAVVNPVAPIFRTNEVTVMSDLARPKVVITASEYRGFELGAMHAELRERCPWVDELVVVGDSGPADSMSWDELLEHGRLSSYDGAAVALVRPNANDVSEVMFTSGTTGQPKGVMHNHNTLNVAGSMFIDEVCSGIARQPNGPVFHMASTLAHQTGYLYGIRAPIIAGGSVVYQDSWNPTEFVGLVTEHRIQISMGATPFLADVLAVDGIETADLASWERFVCAGAAVPEPVLERADATLPCVVLPGWGMTECGLLTVGRPSDPFELRITDGIALPGNEVRVIDEDGAAVTGVEGDLQFRGSLGFVGYKQGRALTESVTTADGWIDTGDRAIHLDSGHIQISGRTKDLVIRGGENVPVKEVEDVLLRHPAIENVAIVAQPHERLGEIGCAFVIASGEAPSLADLTDFLANTGMTRQFWPEALVVVDEFPMTPSGKVQKYKLRDSTK
jgi:cyclohexanecarboxylate-CoA ligase